MRSAALWGWKILGAYSFVAKRFSEELSEWYVAAQSYQRTQERVDAVNSMFTKLLYFGNVACRWGIGALGAIERGRGGRFCPADRYDLHAAVYVYRFADPVFMQVVRLFARLTRSTRCGR